MQYIYANASDFGKIENYLKSKELDYIIDGNEMNIEIPKEGNDLTLIIQYLDISHIWINEEDEEEEENDDDLFHIVIIQLDINTENLMSNNDNQKMINKYPLDLDELRPGMIIRYNKKEDAYYGKNFMVVYSDRINFVSYITLLEETTVGFSKLEFKSSEDIIFCEGFEMNGCIVFNKQEQVNCVKDYNYVGYAKKEFFYKVRMFNEEHYFSKEACIEEYPYDFMEKESIFMELFSILEPIRAFSNNTAEAIKMFLYKIGFEMISKELIVILMTAIEYKNDDILDLVDIFTEKFKELETEDVINTILMNYSIFLENMFVNHLEEKNISINHFISFVIKKY